MKVGIFSITLDRLYYTLHCFKTLKENAGYPYEHLIIDNGSTDGTPEFLKEEGYNIICNEKNEGITRATRQAILYFKDKVDIIIKVDPDAEFITPSTIAKIVEFFKKNNEYLAVSPIIRGLGNPPTITSQQEIKGIQVGRVDGVGGIFRASKMDDFIHLASEIEGLNDKSLFDFCKKNGYKMAYLPELEINHFETTKGQEKRYPVYFSKEYKL